MFLDTLDLVLGLVPDATLVDEEHPNGALVLESVGGSRRATIAVAMILSGLPSASASKSKARTRRLVA
jgi:hypothetical protein